MNIERLASGSYRIREMHKGKQYRITVDHKPTKREAQELLYEEYSKSSQKQEQVTNLTLGEACELYNEIKEAVLSPSTIRDYIGMVGRISPGLKEMKLTDITAAVLQKEVGRYSKGHSPKTVKNYCGYIQAVMKQFMPGFSGYNITLPKQAKKEPYIPTHDEVRTLVQEATGTEYEIIIKLACYGLRRSEALAVTADDLDDGNVLHINKAMVTDKNGKYVIKPIPKTEESVRDIYISDDLAALIRARGRAYDGFPGSVLRFMKRVQDKYGMEHFPLHKMRHYFATALSEQGVPEADILRLGGWSKSGDIMKQVYRHATISRDAERRKKITEAYTDNIF